MVACALVAVCPGATPRPIGAGQAVGDGRVERVEGPVGIVPARAVPTPPPDGTDRLPDPGVAPGGCRLVTYTPATAAQALVGELCRPPSDQRDVAVVIVHGGSGVGGSYDGMRAWAERYRAEGYVTLLPAYHLFTPGSGERPVFPRPEQNIKASVQYLRGVARALGVRRDRLVVQGQSAGARVGAVAFTTPDDPWFAGRELHADLSSAVDAFIGFYHPYDGTMQYADQYFGGGDGSTDPAVSDRLDHADSLRRAGAAAGPALFVTGSRDWNLIVAHQDAFVAALRARGIEARAVVVEGGAHGFDQGGARLSRLGERAAAETLRFLNDAFPQVPARPAQVSTVDLGSAPGATGVPATTATPRVPAVPPAPASPPSWAPPSTAVPPTHPPPSSPPPSTRPAAVPTMSTRPPARPRR